MQKKTSPQQIRIIAGNWKRTPLTVLDAPGLRPTPDRVRETVFNWLDFLFQSNWSARRCLDLFAGSGALGFEAASRGALQVTLVDSYGPAVEQLERLRERLKATQIQIVRGDAMVLAKKMVALVPRFDVIFLDPPFHRDLLNGILVDCIGLLQPTGLLYLEAEKQLTVSDLPDCLLGWEIVRADRAGKVFFHLLRRSNATLNAPGVILV